MQENAEAYGAITLLILHNICWPLIRIVYSFAQPILRTIFDGYLWPARRLNVLDTYTVSSLPIISRKSLLTSCISFQFTRLSFRAKVCHTVKLPNSFINHVSSYVLVKVLRKYCGNNLGYSSWKQWIKCRKQMVSFVRIIDVQTCNYLKCGNL